MVVTIVAFCLPGIDLSSPIIFCHRWLFTLHQWPLPLVCALAVTPTPFYFSGVISNSSIFLLHLIDDSTIFRCGVVSHTHSSAFLFPSASTQASHRRSPFYAYPPYGISLLLYHFVRYSTIFSLKTPNKPPNKENKINFIHKMVIYMDKLDNLRSQSLPFSAI